MVWIKVQKDSSVFSKWSFAYNELIIIKPYFLFYLESIEKASFDSHSSYFPHLNFENACFQFPNEYFIVLVLLIFIPNLNCQSLCSFLPTILFPDYDEDHQCFELMLFILLYWIFSLKLLRILYILLWIFSLFPIYSFRIIEF